MTVYVYLKDRPDLDALQTAILGSTLADVYSGLRWDESDGKLKVTMIRDLLVDEISLLDSLVAQV